MEYWIASQKRSHRIQEPTWKGEAALISWFLDIRYPDAEKNISDTFKIAETPSKVEGPAVFVESSEISSNWSSLEVEFIYQNIHVDERWTLLRHHFFPEKSKLKNVDLRPGYQLSSDFFRDSYVDWKYTLWLWSSITLKSSRVSTNPSLT